MILSITQPWEKLREIIMSEQLVRKKLGEFVKSDDVSILEVPQKLFHPYRILILKILYSFGYADFRQLKHDLQITDGNLASHLRALEKEGYVKVDKQIIKRKPRTTYTLTKKGLRAFQQLRTRILKVMKSDIER